MCKSKVWFLTRGNVLMCRVFQTRFFANTCGSGQSGDLSGESRAKCDTTGSLIVHNGWRFPGGNPRSFAAILMASLWQREVAYRFAIRGLNPFHETDPWLFVILVPTENIQLCKNGQHSTIGCNQSIPPENLSH